MNKRNHNHVVIVSVALLLFSLSCMGLCSADSTLLYIRDQSYPKALFAYERTLYAVADDIFPRVELKMRIQGRVLCGGTPDYTGPLCPQHTADSFLYVDGKPITRGVLVRHDKVWISIPVLAKAIGYIYQYNHETGIADLFSPVAVSPAVYAEMTSLSGRKAPKSLTKTPKTKTKEKSKQDENEIPVEVQNLSQMMDPNTYEVRTFFDVKNISPHEVKGITATLSYLDGNGNPILKRAFNIGTLGDGAVAKENDYWINTTRIYGIKADIKLDWEGKKKS